MARNGKLPPQISAIPFVSLAWSKAAAPKDCLKRTAMMPAIRVFLQGTATTAPDEGASLGE
jgi:hypothetical protein